MVKMALSPLTGPTFEVKFGPVYFEHFQGQITRFLGFFKVGLELFRSCLGIVFGLKRPTFKCIFSSKRRYMTSKIKILGQNLALRKGHFDHFQGLKSLDFFFYGIRTRGRAPGAQDSGYFPEGPQGPKLQDLHLRVPRGPKVPRVPVALA